MFQDMSSKAKDMKMVGTTVHSGVDESQKAGAGVNTM